MYSMVSVINQTVLYIWKLLWKVYVFKVLHREKKIC